MCHFGTRQITRMYKAIILLFIVACTCCNVFAQTDWKLSTESNGIKIYTGSVPGSKIKAVKVECDFKTSMSQFVAVLLDIKASPGWLYHTKLCRVIKTVSPQNLYYYSIITLPWPAENRDFVCHLTVNQNHDTKVVTVNGPAVPGFVPIDPTMVRVSNSASLWTITPIGNNILRVVYTLHVDPQGELPAWLVNMFGTEGPMQIFKNLQNEVEKPVYKNVSLPFIAD